MGIDHEILPMVLLPILQIQEGQLSVTSERSHLDDYVNRPIGLDKSGYQVKFSYFWLKTYVVGTH